jgi:hypothetical protein
MVVACPEPEYELLHGSEKFRTREKIPKSRKKFRRPEKNSEQRIKKFRGPEKKFRGHEKNSEAMKKIPCTDSIENIAKVK